MAGTRERLRLIFCLPDPARPTTSGIVTSQPWGMRAMLLPRRPIRPPSKAGPNEAPGRRTPRFTGCPLRRRIPDICTENPRDALPPIAPVRRSMAATSSRREDWRKCLEVDLRRLRQRGPRRGRIRGEGASRRYWSTSTSPAPRGTLRTPRRARAL